MITLKTEITEYEDFANSPDGMDNYLAPIFGSTLIKDYSAEFATARFLEARIATTKMYFDGAKALLKGLTFGSAGITLVYVAYSITTL